MKLTERRKHFELFYRYLKEGKDFEKLSLRDLLWKVYNQACIDCGQDSSEISIEETQKIIEDEMFFDFISDCLLHPCKNKPVEENDYVKVTYDCSLSDRDKCIAWPDRCEDACQKHSVIINLSKLCGIDSDKEETLNDKILSKEEINELAKALNHE